MLLNASRASRANLIESRLPLLLTIVVLLLIFTPLSISKARNKAGLAALSNRLSKTAILSLPSANSGTSPTIANPRFILTNASAMLLTFSPLNTESTECIKHNNPAASLSVSLALSILDFTSSIFLNRSMLCFDGNSVSSNDREIFFTVIVGRDGGSVETKHRAVEENRRGEIEDGKSERYAERGSRVGRVDAFGGVGV
jgi:hypothetical protein